MEKQIRKLFKNLIINNNFKNKKEILKLTSDIEAILTMFLTKQLLLHKSLKGVQEDLEETFEARDFLDSMKDLKNSENKKSDG